ncbi:MAG TPA: 23S rRNA (pseudouridine(1915)-N(3))-methyltransferase RlmH [Polyangiaceae bacterium]|nr:23S rRNA (pseudouridine(1915)-N(3))-methyltransferase RlmH [Polyangiaceae bacterium]
MKFVVVAVGKIRDAPLRAAADDYFARVRRYVSCDEREAKNGEQLERLAPEGALRVALEVDGEQLSSQVLAERVERWAARGKGEIAFFIGGAEGIPKDVSARADVRLSLSKLTLPHRLARVILAEQLYRTMTIIRGEPYAREG